LAKNIASNPIKPVNIENYLIDKIYNNNNNTEENTSLSPYKERINDIIFKHGFFKENNVVPKSENIIWLIDQLINIKWKIEPIIFPNPECTQNEYGFTLQWDNKNDMISCEITFYDEENKIEGYFHNYNIINKNSTETYLDLSLHLSWNMLNNMVYNLFTLKPSNEYNNEELKEVFLKLKEQWLNETCFSSNSKVYTENHNYKEIIKLGKDVVPFIIDEFLSGYYNLYRFKADKIPTLEDITPELWYQPNFDISFLLDWKINSKIKFKKIFFLTREGWFKKKSFAKKHHD
jgi:hypothetical protein